MTGTPSERAAALSARIHREINAGQKARFELHIGRDCTQDEANSLLVPVYGVELVPGAFDRLFNDSPFFRLGAELRAIALGNNRGAR